MIQMMLKLFGIMKTKLSSGRVNLQKMQSELPDILKEVQKTGMGIPGMDKIMSQLGGLTGGGGGGKGGFGNMANIMKKMFNGGGGTGGTDEDGDIDMETLDREVMARNPMLRQMRERERLQHDLARRRAERAVIAASAASSQKKKA